MITTILHADRTRLRELTRLAKTFNDKEISIAMGLVDDYLLKGSQSSYEFFCARDESGQCIGYICFGSIDLSDNCYDLYWIVVDERFQKEGIGQALLTEMERTIAGRKGKKIFVDTSSTPPYEAARRFYRKNGYHTLCTIKDFYRRDDHKILLMKEMPCSD